MKTIRKTVGTILTGAILTAGTAVLGVSNATANTSSAKVTPTEQVISAGCTTNPTGANGVRHDCWSIEQTLTAPKNYFFAEKLTTGGKGSAAGSTHVCTLKWHDYVDLFEGSGVMLPTRVTLQAHALGPKGHLAGRGWANCEYKVYLSTLPNS